MSNRKFTPEEYKVYRVTRDENLHETLLPHYLKFFAAMSREATTPPPLSPLDEKAIKKAVEDSMNAHIDYTFWSCADTGDEVPEPDLKSD